jgi:membrane protein required for colicin V production
MMENWPVNPVDIVVLIVLVISGALAFFRGFVHEVLGIGAWIGAILAAIYGLPHAQPYARQYIPIDWAADLAAVIVIFLGVLLVLSFITAVIARRVQESALNTVDRTLGFLFGLARGGVIVVVLYIAASWLVPPDTQPVWVQQARSMPTIQEGAQALVALVPEDLLAAEEGTPAEPGAEASGTGLLDRTIRDDLMRPDESGRTGSNQSGTNQ